MSERITEQLITEQIMSNWKQRFSAIPPGKLLGSDLFIMRCFDTITNLRQQLEEDKLEVDSKLSAWEIMKNTADRYKAQASEWMSLKRDYDELLIKSTEIIMQATDNVIELLKLREDNRRLSERITELEGKLQRANEDNRSLNIAALMGQEYLEGLVIRSAHNRFLTDEITPITDKINSIREAYLAHLSDDRARIQQDGA